MLGINSSHNQVWRASQIMKGPEAGDKELEIHCNLFQELGSSGGKNNILLEVTKKLE